MIAPLSTLYHDQELEKLRFSFPRKFVFLCGGIISPVTSDTKASSLRDYLYRIRHFQRRLHASVVLAETATDLYHSTTYTDLISFEEDIAKIASIVLVIPESPGSLAELGAFATEPTIRQALRVVMQERFEDDRSFIRFGPIDRIIRNHGRDFVGFYPWRVNSSQRVVVRSIKPEYLHLVRFINGHIDKVSVSKLLSVTPDVRLFGVIYWIIYLLVAVPVTVLSQCVMTLLPGTRHQDITNKLYCMILAGWVKKIPYSGKDYYYVTGTKDPFRYSYKPTARERDTLRRKTDIATAFKKLEDIPKSVLTRAIAGREPGSK